jgi:hypothetical protein
MVSGAVTLTTIGDVAKIAIAQDASNRYSTTPFTTSQPHTSLDDGHSQISIPVKCNNIKTGHPVMRLHNPIMLKVM